VEGTATARLLPFPSVTFTDVVVAGVEPGEPAMTVETFSMDAELAPFMRGDVHIFDMRLVRPSVLIDVAEDGTVYLSVRAPNDGTLWRYTPASGEAERIASRVVGEGMLRTLLIDGDMRTLPVALAILSGEHVQDTELMMAGAVLTVLPVMLVFVVLQRHYLEGISIGAIKG
jgi:hypothetical protein